tara:strand:+ start:3579 stop:4166 length:588 start_codon:yes stop_codon:yes gene_type:complete
MKEHKINSQYDFIQGYYIENNKITDDLINHFKTSNNKTQGMIGNGMVDKEIKESTDLAFNPLEINFYSSLSNYFKSLSDCLEIYKNKYSYCHNKIDAWSITDKFNIQKYKPGEGYHRWHCERGGKNTLRRHLVFMTYLNDVKQGGETEWYYQKLKVKPEKGLTLIWPTDWTFTHKGHTAVNEDKYIITGWYDFNK